MLAEDMGLLGERQRILISLFQTTQKTVDQSPQPPVSKLKQIWAQVDVAHNGLVSRLRVLSLENHNLKKKEMTANLSSLFQEGDIISFKLVCKQTCFQL